MPIQPIGPFPLTPPTTYAVQTEKTSPKFAAAFARGCHGPVTGDHSTLLPGDFAAFCTPPVWPLLAQAQAEGRDWYYGDHGLFRRFQYYRVARNAYQPNGVSPVVLTRGRYPTEPARPDRFLALRITLAPAWQSSGTAIVICPNSLIYMARYGLDAHAWVTDLVRQIGEVSDRPIVVRWKAYADRRPLYLDLHDAWIVVVFSSASAIEALAAGVPVCTLAPWASTASMGITSIHNVEHPHYPSLAERDQFLFNLAAQQYTLSEIADGLAWRTLHQI